MRRGLLLAAAAALVVSPCLAQDSAAAEALFTKALTHMEAKQYESACPMIAESYRLDPRPGTLFTLAECEANAGKVASAIAHYSDYLQVFTRMPSDQRARQLDRDRVAAEQIAKLQPQVPQLVLTLPAKAPPGTLVRRGDVQLRRPSLGIPLPVDPGEHVVTTQAPGGPLKTVRITIGPGETKHVELEVDLPAAVAPSEPNGQAKAAGPPLPSWSRQGPEKDRVESGPGPQRMWAYILGGLALEGLAVGTVTGLMAWDKKSVINRECDGNVCSPDGKDAGTSAHTLGTLSTISFSVGAAALAGATVLWLTDPSTKRRESTGITPIMTGSQHGGLVGIRGGF